MSLTRDKSKLIYVTISMIMPRAFSFTISFRRPYKKTRQMLSGARNSFETQS